MAMSGLGLVKQTTSFGRKRILILNHMGFHSIDVPTPKKKQFLERKSGFCCQKSALETLPLEILIKILCGVEHDDLKKLFHVLIVKKWHFEYTTPKKIPAFRCSVNFEEFSSNDFGEIEAPKQSRVHRARKNSGGICLCLFDVGDL